MARGSNQATEVANTGQSFANTAGANANALYGTLAPELLNEAANPPGAAPSDLAAQNTALEQSAGGSEAGAVGQGALMSARTRNAGGADAAIGQGVRGAGENLSKGALGIQINNARLKEEQRRAATGGLEGLYAGQLGAEPANLNAATGGVNANTNAANASWDWTKSLSAFMPNSVSFG